MPRKNASVPLVCTLLLLAGFAGNAPGQQYPFLAVAGAPKNVKHLFQDSVGRLWVGGERLGCFDGTRFFFLEDYGLPAGPTYAVTEDTGGAIWIAAETGLFRFSNGRVETITQGVTVSIVPASPDVVVAAIGPLGKGFPAKSSLVRIQRTGATWKAETVMNLQAPGPFTLDHAGRLLFVLPDKGWNEIRLRDIVDWRPGRQLAVQRNAAHDAVPALGPMRALRDRFGCVWIGADGFNNYNCGGGWTHAPFEGASVRSDIHEAPDGTMLLVGYNILAVGRPGAFRIAKPVNGLPQQFVAIQAVDGTIWLGGAPGLYRFASPFRMEYWTGRDGIDNPWAVQRVGENIYAGLDRDVAVLGKDRQHWQSIASFAKIGQVENLLPVDDRNMLVALNKGGAVQIQTDGTVVARINVSPLHYGLRLARTPSGDAWLGGLGLGRLVRVGPVLKFEDDHAFETRTAGNVLDVQYEGHTRKLWSCYTGGLVVRNEDETWREFTTKDGLLVNPCWSLAALPNGDVWYGYYNTPSLARVRPKADGSVEVKQFRAADELKDPESLTLDLDQRGWLWRGGNSGLSVADPANAEAGRWLYLDQTDGLSGAGPNTGSYFADRDGSIWMGIDISVFHYLPPPDLLTPNFAPRIFLSAISWDKNAPRLSEAVEGLPSGAKATAHIGSLQFDRRNGMRLRYRVRPEQASWTESSSLDLALGSLSSGPHSLEVQARVFTGPWSPVLTRSFTVQRPMWRSVPLLFLYALTGCFIAVGGYLMHRRRMAEEAQLLPALGDLRLRTLSLDADGLTGTLLDSRFEVGDLLARGGFANVMAGYDRAQKRRCAVKVFRNELRNQDWIQWRFVQEVAALEKIRHPHVVSIYAHGNTPSGAPYLVMEFVEGKNMGEVLEGGALSPRRAAKLLRQLGGALEAVHAQGIWHRDVKPENIIVRDEASEEESAVLIDFSLAIVKNANESLYGNTTQAAGTPHYMAPEQSMGYASASSDIYSLAKVVIELLAGKRLHEILPSASPDLADKVRELLKGETLDVHLSQNAIEALCSAVEFDPAKRPHAAALFADMLARELESDSPIQEG